MSPTDVTIVYLEMHDPNAVRPVPVPPELTVTEAAVKQFRFNRFLYELVGGSWDWTDKLSWSDAQWQAYAEGADLRTWVAYHGGAPAGYYELQQQTDGDVEIAYFGLSPAFIGKGYGGYLLTHALESAWNLPGTRRVWVHTCTLDHPGALPNYLARGMVEYNREVQM